MTRLPVQYQFRSPFIATYSKVIPVKVSTSGRPIRHLTAGLYTFGGDRVAFGRAARRLWSSGWVRMRVHGGRMQAGEFTLVLLGEPNRDRHCGPKHLYRVVRFRPCPDRLPVSFPRLPEGLAADHLGGLSVDITAGRQLLSDLSVSVRPAPGGTVTRMRVPDLFGEIRLTFQPQEGARPGEYVIQARGKVSEMPAACGPLKASARFWLS